MSERECTETAAQPEMQVTPSRRGGKTAMLGFLAAAAMLGGGSSRVFRSRPEPKQGNSHVDNRLRERADAKRKRKAAKRLSAATSPEPETDNG